MKPSTLNTVACGYLQMGPRGIGYYKEEDAAADTVEDAEPEAVEKAAPAAANAFNINADATQRYW